MAASRGVLANGPGRRPGVIVCECSRRQAGLAGASTRDAVAVAARRRAGSLRRPHAGRVFAQAPESSSAQPPSALGDSASPQDDAVRQALLRSDLRAKHLDTLVGLRSLYRSLLRARYWLTQPQPLLSSHPASSVSEEFGGTGAGADLVRPEDLVSVDEAEEVAWALDAVAEIALTCDQLAEQLAKLPTGFGAVFQSLDVDAARDGEARVESISRGILGDLTARFEAELATLPFGSRTEALRAVRQRITNETQAYDSEEADAGAEGGGSMGLRQVLPAVADRAAVRIVKRVKASSKGMLMVKGREEGAGVGAKPEAGFQDSIQGAADYARGVWVRLNGGGTSTSVSMMEAAQVLPEGLPRPVPLSEGEASVALRLMGKTSDGLSIEVDRLDKELKEASKNREQALRKAGVLGRARLAEDLRGAEEEVSSLRTRLALKTLELEMNLIFKCLENECLQIIENTTFLPWRRGSTQELRLLVAEYALHDSKLAHLGQLGEALAPDAAQEATEQKAGAGAGVAVGVGAGGAASEGSGAKGLVLNMPMLGDEDKVLAELVVDIPDLRTRLGITDKEVVNLSLDARLQNVAQTIDESTTKVKDGFFFMGRGVKLLVTDLGNCGSLFGRALLGSTLQPREVETLRRTARDVLTFVPFIIILILPITPVGHVLVFSFIQQSFPALFPSQFTSSRQKSMVRYEELKKQLDEVQEQEGYVMREEQFQKAVKAVEELTANVTVIKEDVDARLAGMPYDNGNAGANEDPNKLTEDVTVAEANKQTR